MPAAVAMLRPGAIRRGEVELHATQGVRPQRGPADEKAGDPGMSQDVRPLLAAAAACRVTGLPMWAYRIVGAVAQLVADSATSDSEQEVGQVIDSARRFAAVANLAEGGALLVRPDRIVAARWHDRDDFDDPHRTLVDALSHVLRKAQSWAEVLSWERIRGNNKILVKFAGSPAEIPGPRDSVARYH